MPGAHNAMAALQARKAGFQALYLSGAAMSAQMGLPDLGIISVEDVCWFIKQIVRTSWSRTLDQELDLQRDEMRRLGFTHDYREGVAAFLEKRPAKFKGR